MSQSGNTRHYRVGDEPRIATGKQHVFILDVLLRCGWSKKRRYLLENVELVVDLLRQVAGELQLTIYDKDNAGQPIEKLTAAITGKQVRVPWTVLEDDVPDNGEQTVDDEGVPITINALSKLYFEVALGSLTVCSGQQEEALLHVIDKLHVLLVGDDGQPIGECTANVELPDGSERQIHVAADGMLLIPEVPGGSCIIDTCLPNKIRVSVLTVDHRDDKPHRVRIPAAFADALPVPAGGLAALFSASAV